MHIARCCLWLVAALLSLSSARAHAQSAPVIEHLEPSAGPVGTRLQVVGRGFVSGAQVMLGDVELVVERVSPSRIVSRVTEHAKTGAVSVRTATGVSRGPQFRVTEPVPAPEIRSFAPSSGPPGTEITITGSGFASGLSRTQVSLGEQPLVLRSATPTELIVIVAESASSGPLTVRTAESEPVQSATAFQVSARSEVLAIEPRGVAAGGSVKVIGNGFAAAASDNRVYLNNARCTVTQATPTELLVQLPARAATGRLVIDIRGGGRTTSPMDLVVQQMPILSSVSPSKGLVGAVITITGKHFGNDASAIEAKLGDVALPIRQAQDARLVAEIPAGAVSGALSVTVNAVGPVSLSNAFEVLEPLALTSFTPRAGPLGTLVRIAGTGFSPSAAANQVRMAGRSLDVVSATAHELTVRVTPGASGPLEVSVTGSGTVRSHDPFVVKTPPIVVSYAPLKATIGAEVTIRGSRFGQDPLALKVTLHDQAQEIVSVRDDVVVIRIAPGAQSGRFIVSSALQGNAIVETPFVVLPALVVLRALPERAAPGDVVDVRGSGFEAGMVAVLGEAVIEPESITPERMRFVVPADATGGVLTVRLRDGREASAPRQIAIVR